MHGDFRHGNLIVGPDRRARACWTGSSRISATRWRISAGSASTPGASARSTSRSGGFGSREELFAGYEEAGRRGRSGPRDVLGSDGHAALGRHVLGMMQRFRIRPDRSMERAMIGRQSSETEIDLLRLLAPREVMQDEPTPTELIKAVADFLRNEITPEIKGHNAFKLRVGIDALDLVTRQLALEQGSDAAEAARLKAVAERRRLADRVEPRAVGKDCRRRGRSADARALGTSVADDDGQARRSISRTTRRTSGSWGIE